MKLINKTVYVVIVGDKETEKDTLQAAEEVKSFLKEFSGILAEIEQRPKTEYEIEKGDRVHWVKNGVVDTSRIDIVTAIVKNGWGDTVYNTQELNGAKKGQAYKQDVQLVF